MYLQLVLFLSILVTRSFAKRDNVKVLNKRNFDSVVGGGTPALVEFYAPWCGHCRKLEPTYEKIGAAFAPYGDKVTIAKVNGDEEKELSNRFGIKGFPTLFWFDKGVTSNPEKYSGGRELKNIADFVEKKTGIKPSIKSSVKYAVTLTKTNYQKIVRDPKKAVLVEYYNDHCLACNKFEDDYQQLAKLFESNPSVLVAQMKIDENKALLNDLNLQYNNKPILKFFPAGNHKNPIDFSGEQTLKGLVEFMNSQLGLRRNPNGKLEKNAGVIQEFDNIIKLFFQAEENKRQSHMQSASNLAKEVKDDSTTYYIKIMEKVDAQGTGFLGEEVQRLRRLMEDDENTSSVKLDEFQVRINILKHFAQHAGIDIPDEEKAEEEEGGEQEL